MQILDIIYIFSDRLKQKLVLVVFADLDQGMMESEVSYSIEVKTVWS